MAKTNREKLDESILKLKKGARGNSQIGVDALHYFLGALRMMASRGEVPGAIIDSFESAVDFALKSGKIEGSAEPSATIRRATVSYCQVCARDFKSPELVYYAPIDGNIVCSECAQVHRDKQLRIYVREE